VTRRAALGAGTEAARIAAQERIARPESRRDLLIAEQGHWLTRLPRLLFVLPLAVWWAAVVADSLFGFEWDVAALPHPLDDSAGWIVSALFLAESAEKVTARLTSRG